jgi:hypothetical protein
VYDDAKYDRIVARVNRFRHRFASWPRPDRSDIGGEHIKESLVKFGCQHDQFVQNTSQRTDLLDRVGNLVDGVISVS